MPMYNNVGHVMKQVTGTQHNIERATIAMRNEMAMLLTQLAKEEIKGKRQPGEVATIGEPPKNRTGNLRRSIKAEKHREGFGTYVAIVGPTVIYGRSLEIGGKYAPPTWRNDNKYPFMQPAFRKFKREAQAIIRKHMRRIKP